MRGMNVVGFECGGIGEFHDTADDEILTARRNIFSDMRFEHQRDLAFQRGNFTEHALLLRFGYAGLQSKSKHVNEHRWVSFCCKKYLKILGDAVRLCQ